MGVDESGLPERIGHYAIDGVLGEGGMGTVYRACDTRLGRAVALKALRPSLMNGQTLERFQREAQHAARLRHPNIVTVYEAGQDGDAWYIAMEVVEGRSLAEWRRVESPPLRRQIAVLEQVARAAHYAHEHGVVHRDLKPANIQVDAEGRPHLLDFGLSRAAGTDAGMTRTGSVVGTPLYMAPEQVRGDVREIDARTDVFALGAILYEILAGRPPFAGSMVGDVYGRILQMDPEPPRARDPRVPRELEAIALKAIEKSPRRRYASAAAFADDLSRFLAGEPTEVRPATPVTRVWRRVVRHRAVVFPTTVAVLLAAVMAAWALAMSRSRAEGEARVRDREEALKLVERAGAIVERGVRSRYSRDTPLEEPGQLGEEARTLLAKAVTLAPDLASARHLLGRACELANRHDEAIREWRQAVALDASHGPAHFHLGRALVERAYIATCTVEQHPRADISRSGPLAAEAVKEIDLAMSHGSGFDDELQRDVAAGMVAYARGDRAEVVRLVTAALARFRDRQGAETLLWLRAQGLQDPSGQREALDRAIEMRPKWALALFCRAALRLRMEDAPGARADLDAALAIAPDFAEARINRSIARQKAADLAGALEDADEAVRLRPDLAATWYNRGGIRGDLGRFDEAEADLREALHRSPHWAPVHTNLGMVRKRKGDVDGAIEHYTRAIELDPECALAWLNRSVAWNTKGDRARARADIDEAIRRGDLPGAWYNRALQRRDAGEYAAAIEDCTQAIQRAPEWALPHGERAFLRRTTGDPQGALEDADRAVALSPGVSAFHNERGILLDARGERAKAREAFDRAVELDPGNVEAHANRGVVRRKMGDVDGAIADFERVLKIAPETWIGRATVREFLDEARRARDGK